jgi:hypothetical protein
MNRSTSACVRSNERRCASAPTCAPGRAGSSSPGSDSAPAEHLLLVAPETQKAGQEKLRAVRVARRLELDAHAARREAHPDRAERPERLAPIVGVDPRRHADDGALPHVTGENRELGESGDELIRAAVVWHGGRLCHGR